VLGAPLHDSSSSAVDHLPDGDSFGPLPGLDQTFAESQFPGSTEAFLIKLVAQ